MKELKISYIRKISYFVTTFFFLFSIFYFLFSIPGVSAQDNTSIDVSCAKYQYPWCQEAKEGIGPLVGRFYIIALGLAAAAALGVLIYGAILWTVSGAVTSKQDALQWIWGAIWGLVLLLGAYLILYTINPDLVKLKGPEELMKSINLQSISGETTTPGTLPPELAGRGLTQSQAQARLDAAGIETKSSRNCTDRNNPGCTSLEGVKENTIEGTIAFKGGCSVFNQTVCDTTITGGTETGHATGPYSHANGYKLDIDPNSQVNNYIMNSGRFEKLPPRGVDSVYRDKVTGYVYVYERAENHWDITFTSL